MLQGKADVKSFLALGSSYFKLGQYQELINFMEGILKKDPTCFQVKFPIAVAAFNLKDFTKAEQNFKAYLGEKPGHPDCLYGLIVIACANEKYDLAGEYVSQLQEGHPIEPRKSNLKLIIEALEKEGKTSKEMVEGFLEKF